MSPTIYYLAWLAAGLVAIAIASAVIARHIRLQVLRRARAEDLLDALARYSGWIAAQQRALFFQGDAQGQDSALEEVRAIQREWFPELADEVAQLFEVHAHLIDFLWAEQVSRLRDGEAWLESDHDARFAHLWQFHRMIVGKIGERLRRVAPPADPELERRSTSPA